MVSERQAKQRAPRQRAKAGAEEGTERLGLRAYARHRGVRLSAVQKAIKDGRIERGKDGKIDRAAADQAWAENTYTGWGGKRTSAAEEQAEPADEKKPDPPKDTEAEEQSKTIRRAQATKEHYLAEKRKLEFELLSGKVVDREQRDREEFERLRFVRDELLQLADRIASALGSELGVDAGVVHSTIDTEVRRALEATADALETGEAA